MEKLCKECNEVKNATEFRRNHKTKDGYLNTCTSCLQKNKTVKGSLRQAINDKCKECIYDPIGGSGTWVQQVRDCTSPGCPLFNVRPGV